MHKAVATKDGGRQVEMTPQEESDFIAQQKKDDAAVKQAEAEDKLIKEQEAVTRQKLILNAGLTEEEADLILMKP